MSVDGNSNCNADTLANTLFSTLTAGKDFTPPAVDLSGLAFQYPTLDPIVAPTPITEADLTERLVNGSGMFDGLMEALRGHLQLEFDKGRITGKEYATAYVSMTEGALGNSVQFLLQKDSAYWQAQLVQAQAQTAQVGLVTARIEAEIAKARLVQAQMEAHTTAANYALSKMQLSTEDAKYCGIQAQTLQTNYQTEYLLPAQYDNVRKTTEKLDFEIDYLLPNELIKSAKDIELITSQISTSTAQKDQILYQTASILPAQKLGYEADTALKNYQLTAMLPAQVAGHTADNATKIYTNSFLLPAQLTSLMEQNEGHRAKTMDTRMDGVTPIKGAIGKQVALQEEQIVSYKRDAESKLAKMLLDTWITQYSINEAVTPPASISDTNINRIVNGLAGNLHF